MPKQNIELNNLFEKGLFNRKLVYNFYINKYYNLFMNSYSWVGIDDEQKDFLMRKFWGEGKVACFKLKHSETDDNPEGLLVFTPFAPSEWNIYDFPTKVMLINKRGVKFIPQTMQEVNKDVVIGWAQRNKKGVFFMVDYYIQKIVDVEMILRTNLKASKTPWIIGVDSESDLKMNKLWENINSDDPKLFVNLDQVNNAKALVSGAPYNADKLYAMKCAYENELREFLGINNLGNQEKKEHLITSEVDANNEITASSGDCFFDCLKEFCNRIKEVFNYNIDVILNKPVMPTYEEDEEENEYDEE